MSRRSFLKMRGAFRWHFAHPHERDPDHEGYRHCVCGWAFYTYHVVRAQLLEDLESEGQTICEVCRLGYYLYLAEE